MSKKKDTVEYWKEKCANYENRIQDHPAVKALDERNRKLEYTLKCKERQIDDLIGALGFCRALVENMDVPRREIG